MIKGVEYSLEVTKDIMLPMLDKITDFEACIEHQKVIGMNINFYEYDDESFGNQNPSNFYNKGLLLIKTNNRDYFKRKMKTFLAERDEKDVDCAWSKQILLSDNIYNNPELYAKALAELERRKTANTKILRSYGLNL